MTTRTERDEAAQTWAETPRQSRRQAAEDRGYDPHPDDVMPARMAADDPWREAFEAAVVQAREIKEKS